MPTYKEVTPERSILSFSLGGNWIFSPSGHAFCPSVSWVLFPEDILITTALFCGTHPHAYHSLSELVKSVYQVLLEIELWPGPVFHLSS